MGFCVEKACVLITQSPINFLQIVLEKAGSHVLVDITTEGRRLTWDIVIFGIGIIIRILIAIRIVAVYLYSSYRSLLVS